MQASLWLIVVVSVALRLLTSTAASAELSSSVLTNASVAHFFCGSRGINLTALSTVDLSYSTSDEQRRYDYSPCSLSTMSYCGSQGGSACQRFVNTGETHVIAFPSSAEADFLLLDRGLSLRVSTALDDDDDDGPSAASACSVSQFTASFLCDSSATSPVVDSVTENSLCY